MKKLMSLFLLLCLVLCVATLQAKNVLYDDTHAQTAGNADWIPAGAYKEMCDMLGRNGFVIDLLSKKSQDQVFSSELLSQYDAVLLAEPNNPYSSTEVAALLDFLKKGGGAFLISDHGNADRNGNGWDAVKIFNQFVPEFGFEFDGNDLYETPVAGKANSTHPVMFGVRGVGCWAGSTITLTNGKPSVLAVSLLESYRFKSPYLVAAEVHKGRVVAIGDSSPFDDGVGSGGHNKLHDSYDSFMYSHPQFAYNAMQWVTKGEVNKRIPSREVPMHNEAKIEEKHLNILVDAAHGNAASDKMVTFEKHMKKNGFKVYYTLNLLKTDMLKKFATVIVPDPSLRYTDAEAAAIVDWFMAGGNLVLACSWDSSKLRGANTLNFISTKLGSVMRFNNDQVRDNKNNTNKPWGLISRTFKKDHPITKGLKSVLVWGTCSLVNRNNQALTEEAGIDIVMMANPTSYNYFNNKNRPGFKYPNESIIPLMAVEKIVHGTLVALGTCNFTDYQYPDSHINEALPGPSPIVHETPLFVTNLIKYLMLD